MIPFLGKNEKCSAAVALQQVRILSIDSYHPKGLGTMARENV